MITIEDIRRENMTAEDLTTLIKKMNCLKEDLLREERKKIEILSDIQESIVNAFTEYYSSQNTLDIISKNILDGEYIIEISGQRIRVWNFKKSKGLPKGEYYQFYFELYKSKVIDNTMSEEDFKRVTETLGFWVELNNERD